MTGLPLYNGYHGKKIGVDYYYTVQFFGTVVVCNSSLAAIKQKCAIIIRQIEKNESEEVNTIGLVM